MPIITSFCLSLITKSSIFLIFQFTINRSVDCKVFLFYFILFFRFCRDYLSLSLFPTFNFFFLFSFALTVGKMADIS